MVNDYRNPIVAEAMKEMKYVNMFNQGVKRVQDMLRENGNREAVFDVSKLTVFCVDVFSNDDSITQTTAQTLLDIPEDSRPLFYTHLIVLSRRHQVSCLLA